MMITQQSRNFIPETCIRNKREGMTEILLLIIPVIAKYILPVGIEQILIIDIGIPIFLPNLFIFLFVIRAKHNLSIRMPRNILLMEFFFCVKLGHR